MQSRLEIGKDDEDGDDYDDDCDDDEDTVKTSGRNHDVFPHALTIN